MVGGVKMRLSELYQYRFLLKEIEKQQEELELLRTKAEKVTPTISDMPRQTGVGDRIGTCGAVIADLSEEIEKNISECQRLRLSIEKYINSIPDSETRLILRMRFIEGEGFRSIADELGYSLQTVFARYQKFIKQAGL
jgi:DNA-directed RNA polymerase specialized sigma subunit